MRGCCFGRNLELGQRCRSRIWDLDEKRKLLGFRIGLEEGFKTDKRKKQGEMNRSRGKREKQQVLERIFRILYRERKIAED